METLVLKEVAPPSGKNGTYVELPGHGDPVLLSDVVGLLPGILCMNALDDGKFGKENYLEDIQVLLNKAA